MKYDSLKCGVLGKKTALHHKILLTFTLKGYQASAGHSELLCKLCKEILVHCGRVLPKRGET